MAVIVLDGPISHADVSRICERARALLEDCGADTVVCDVGRLEADAVTIEALARLQLTARRLGRRIALRGACEDLRALLALVGLSEVLPCGPSGVEPGRQPEEREQARGVEEERDAGDPIP